MKQEHCVLKYCNGCCLLFTLSPFRTDLRDFQLENKRPTVFNYYFYKEVMFMELYVDYDCHKLLNLEFMKILQKHSLTRLQKSKSLASHNSYVDIAVLH